jgi:galactokinase
MSLTLQEIYGEEATIQRKRYTQALRRFEQTFGPGLVRFFRAPGRVNLIGEHTDYNQGFVMPVALDRDVLLLARPRADNRVRLINLERRYPPLSFNIRPDIPPGPAGNWGNYARGAAHQLAQELGGHLKGFDGLIAGRPPYGVPRGVGLSSSSAMTVVVAITLAQLNEWYPDPISMAQHCAEAEWYVGTRGGIMDQFISLLGRRDHALFLDCRPQPDSGYRTELVPLPAGYSILISDSGVRHQNVRGDYNRRVAACRAGVKLLQARFPDATHLRDVQRVPWAELEPLLPEQTTIGDLAAQGIDLGDLPGLTATTSLKVRARCRHVWTENQRVEAAIEALRAGELTRFGQLLNAAHFSARDDYEISCPELEILVDAAREVEGVVGARLTGAGWGGCSLAVVRDAAAAALEAHVEERFRVQTGQSTTIFSCRSAPGAGECLFD